MEEAVNIGLSDKNINDGNKEIPNFENESIDQSITPSGEKGDYIINLLFYV